MISPVLLAYDLSTYIAIILPEFQANFQAQ